MNKKWDITDEQLNRKCIDEVISRVQDIEDTDAVGMIAAQDIIDIVKENLAPTFYNKGVEDARKVVQAKVEDLDLDLDVLKQNN